MVVLDIVLSSFQKWCKKTADPAFNGFYGRLSFYVWLLWRRIGVLISPLVFPESGVPWLFSAPFYKAARKAVLMEIGIEYVSKEILKPYAKNAKKHTEEQIRQIQKSIKEFGFNDPIAIWKNNEVIEGHGRLLAVMSMDEVNEVPIIRLDSLTDEQRRAYILVHNKLTMNTAFDFEALEKALEGITSIDMSEYGFQTISEIEDSLDGFFTSDIPEEKESIAITVIPIPGEQEVYDVIINYLQENKYEYKEK